MDLKQQKPLNIKIISGFYLLLSIGYFIPFMMSFYEIMFSGHENFYGPFALVFSLPILGISFVNLLTFIRIIKGKDSKILILAGSFLNLFTLLYTARQVFYLSEGGNLHISLLVILLIILILCHLYYIFLQKDLESQHGNPKQKLIAILLILMVPIGFTFSYYTKKKQEVYYDKLGEETAIHNQQVEESWRGEDQKVANDNKLLEE